MLPFEKGDIGILRLKNDGVLDSSFGVNGFVNINIGNDEFLGEIALQHDGKILITGAKEPTYEEFSPFFLARLNIDGSYDENFANGGINLIDFLGRPMYINCVLQLQDNKIIIGGSGRGPEGEQAVMLKYNANGFLDSSFGVNGFAQTHFPKYSNGLSIVSDVNDMMLLPDGKLWLTGISYQNSAYATILLVKMNADGTADNSFGNEGYVVPSYPLTLVKGYQSFFVRDNKIVVTGYYRNADGRDDGFAAFRFNLDGSLDNNFGTDGRAVYGFDNLWAEIGLRGGAVQPNGRIILGGFAYPKDDDDYTRIVMIGLQGDDGVTPGNYVKLKKWLKKHGLSWPGTSSARNNTYKVQRSNDGINFVTIASVNKPGDNNSDNNYVYEDPSPAKGNNYYRIAYKDKTGKEIYSNIIIIEENTVNIFPNPVINSIHVQNMQGNKTILKISDMAGNIKMSAISKSDKTDWNISSLKKGYYILYIQQENKEPVYKKFYKE